MWCLLAEGLLGTQQVVNIIPCCLFPQHTDPLFLFLFEGLFFSVPKKVSQHFHVF
jgi:hypothetical protein